MCSSKKYPYPSHGRSSENPRGRGDLKVKILEAKYETKLEFPTGRGEGKTKKPSEGGVWIFSGTAHLQKMVLKECLPVIMVERGPLKGKGPCSFKGTSSNVVVANFITVWSSYTKHHLVTQKIKG